MTEQRPSVPAGSLAGFDFLPRQRLVFGAGTAARVGELAKELGATRVLLVTDPGIVAAGHAARVETSLKEAGLSVAVFDQVRENPSTADVARCLKVAQEARIDFIVGLGGGSSMDTAKGTNFLLTNGGEMKDYWGVGKATKPMLPMIAIPTTSGTGSECQSAALIADEATHQKMACLDPKTIAKVALLDPDLTESLPRGVAACTGTDAIAHAVETAVSRKRTPLSRMFSREAFRLCADRLPEILVRGASAEARGEMLLGAAFAGTAIENSMLGAAHAAANPLTAHYGIVHGQAVGLMLPHVVRFNGEEPGCEEAYAELLAALRLGLDADKSAAEQLAGLLERLLREAGLNARLRDLGLPESAPASLALEASQQWTATFNPRPADPKDFQRLYQAAW
jgi:alcohol dehydrogenase